MADKIITRTDTYDNWESVNPILEQGEQAWDSSSKKMKVGDGVTSWNDLEYATGGNKEIDEVKNKVLSGTGRITIPHEVAGNTVKLYIDKGTTNVGDIVKITVQSRNLINKEMFCDPNNWDSEGYRTEWKLHKNEPSLYLTRKSTVDLGNRSIGTQYRRITGIRQNSELDESIIYLENVEETVRESFYDEYLNELQLERHGFTDIVPYLKVEYNVTLTEEDAELIIPNVYLYSTIESNNASINLKVEYDITSLSKEFETLKSENYSEKQINIWATPLVIRGNFEDDYDYFKTVNALEETFPLAYLILVMATFPSELLQEKEVVESNIHNIIEMYEHGLREITLEPYAVELRAGREQLDGLNICAVNKDTHFYARFSKERMHQGSGFRYAIDTGFLDKENRVAKIQIASLGDDGTLEIDTVNKIIKFAIKGDGETLLWDAGRYWDRVKLILDYNNNLPEYIVNPSGNFSTAITVNEIPQDPNSKRYYPYILRLKYIGEVTEEIISKDFSRAVIEIYNWMGR